MYKVALNNIISMCIRVLNHNKYINTIKILIKWMSKTKEGDKNV